MGETERQRTGEEAMNGCDRHIRLAAGAVVFLALLGPAGNGGAQTTYTLDQALDTAMKNSPTMMHSQMNLDRSRETLNAQQAALKTNLSLRVAPYSLSQDRRFDSRFSDWYTTRSTSTSGTFTVSQPIALTDGTFSITNQLNWQESYSQVALPKTNRAFNNSLSLNFQQPLFTYNRTDMTLRQLKLDLENTTMQYSLQTLSLERQVTQAFYGVYSDKASLDIARDDLKNQEQSYEIIKNKVDAGLSAKEELYQAELNLASSKASLENQEVTLANSLDSFKQLIGIPLDEEIAIQADITFKQVEVIPLERALDQALKSRMELRQRKIDIQTAMDNIIQTQSQNEFKGSLNLSFGLTGNDQQFNRIYQEPTNKETVGISFDIPLWDWGENKSRVKAARIGLKSSQLSLEEEKTDIEIAIRQAYRSLSNLVSQIDIAQQNIRNAQLTYDINLERYKNGDLTSMDLSLYQNQLSQKKISLANAQINYKIGILNLKVLTLWDYVKNQPVIMEGMQ
jgi:outer membrane protein